MIVIVIDSLGKGGAERSVLMLAAELVRQGVELRLVCLFPQTDEYEVPVELRPSLVQLDASGLASAAFRLRRYLARMRVDAVYSTLSRANMAAALATIFSRAILITSERATPIGSYSGLRLQVALACHALARGTVFISHYALREGLPNHALARFVRRRSVVLHNPVTARLAPAEAGARRSAIVARLRAFTQPDAGPVRLLVAARLVDKKGHVEFLDEAADFLRGANVVVDFAGSGPLTDRIAAQIDALGLSAKVRLLGFVEDMEAAYRRADIVLLTSKAEGFGRVGFEAYLAGCLVIGTPENSFQAEVVDCAPAWQIADDFSALPLVLSRLGACATPAAHSDIREMGQALSVDAHARRFLEILNDRFALRVD